ncbi:transmembrane protein, putative [Medicago truncatula]|uniref:Transmembrane protein, putative n=1 Tax=Medicago truncatula TaxID=3880 RepID=G7KCD9_MEDTR|nr:transmembrane protein, putative [Medicago truncatula]
MEVVGIGVIRLGVGTLRMIMRSLWVVFVLGFCFVCPLLSTCADLRFGSISSKKRGSIGGRIRMSVGLSVIGCLFGLIRGKSRTIYKVKYICRFWKNKLRAMESTKRKLEASEEKCS